MYSKKANGIRYGSVIKQKAKIMRTNGATHREIAKALGVGISTVHLWTVGFTLSEEQRHAVQSRKRRPLFSEERRKLAKKLAIANLALYQYKNKYTHKELLEKIRAFYAKNSRIPLKREFNVYGEYKRRFGSWNKAVQLAGFSPNPVIFSKKYRSVDGHPCDSLAEKIIDDYLNESYIPHKRHVPYPGNIKFRADFLVKGVFIEYFGLAREVNSYDQTIKKKQILSASQNIRLVEIYPWDLFPVSRLEQILDFLR